MKLIIGIIGIIGIIEILSVIFFTVAYGGTITGNVPISTIVTSNCTLSSASLDFGTYDPISVNLSSPLDGLTTFQVACTKGANVVITMNNGLYSANAQQTTRAMSNGTGGYLSYELYSNSGRSSVWSNMNPVSYVSTSSTVRTQTVYGRIQAVQNRPAGNYTDTVTVTATF